MFKFKIVFLSLVLCYVSVSLAVSNVQPSVDENTFAIYLPTQERKQLIKNLENETIDFGTDKLGNYVLLDKRYLFDFEKWLTKWGIIKTGDSKVTTSLYVGFCLSKQKQRARLLQ